MWFLFQAIAKETVENFQGKKEAIPIVMPFAPVSTIRILMLKV